MCIIVSKPAKKILPKAIYEESFRINKDGAGFAYILGRDIKVEKGFFKFEEFYEALQEVEHLPLLVHCRITSHGPTNTSNCHPFVFKPKDSKYQWVMAHNGVLAWRSTQKQSDTSCFCEDFLWPTLQEYPNFLDDGYRKLMLQRMINDRNKMVIIRYDKERHYYDEYIINEQAGNKAHGCWFSNESWRPWRGYMNHHGHHGYPDGDGDYRPGKPRINSQPNFPITESTVKPVNGPENHAPMTGTYGWMKNEFGAWVNPIRGLALVKGKWEAFGTEALTHVKPDGWKAPSTPPAEQLKLEGVKDEQREADDKEWEDKLKHLSKEERIALHRFASDYIKASGINKSGWTKMEKIAWLRSDMRETYPSWKNLTDEALDKQMLMEDSDAMITVAEHKQTEKKDQEAVEIARAMMN